VESKKGHQNHWKKETPFKATFCFLNKITCKKCYEILFPFHYLPLKEQCAAAAAAAADGLAAGGRSVTAGSAALAPEPAISIGL
jgi:hypothetical protein